MTEMQLVWEQSTENMLTVDVVKPEGSIMADDLLTIAIVDLGDDAGKKRYSLGLLDSDGIDRIDARNFVTLAEAQAAAERMLPKILAGDYDVMCCMHCGTDVYPDDVICCSCERKYHRN